MVEVIKKLLAVAGANQIVLSGGTTVDAASQRFSTAQLERVQVRAVFGYPPEHERIP